MSVQIIHTLCLQILILEWGLNCDLFNTLSINIARKRNSSFKCVQSMCRSIHEVKFIYCSVILLHTNPHTTFAKMNKLGKICLVTVIIIFCQYITIPISCRQFVKLKYPLADWRYTFSYIQLIKFTFFVCHVFIQIASIHKPISISKLPQILEKSYDKSEKKY